MQFKPKQSEDNIVHIYTDGACRIKSNIKGGSVSPTDPCGFAFYLQYGGLEKTYGQALRGFTNNRMELLAVVRALKTIKSDKFPIKVNTDSALIVNCINQKWYVKWRNNGWTKKGGLKNADLWQQLIEQYERFDFISFNHVKGHSGILGNELVDGEINRLMDILVSKRLSFVDSEGNEVTL